MVVAAVASRLRWWECNGLGGADDDAAGILLVYICRYELIDPKGPSTLFCKYLVDIWAPKVETTLLLGPFG